jgi:NTE family protein
MPIFSQIDAWRGIDWTQYVARGGAMEEGIAGMGGRVAFVLPGGASYGAAQVGMLRALVEAGIRPDLVIGTSAGALNAVGFATDPTIEGVAALDVAWREARRSKIFRLSPVSVTYGLIGRHNYFINPGGLRDWIVQHLNLQRLEHTLLPAHVVTTDVDTGEPVVLSKGPAVEALLASCAIPAVFPPVEIGGRLLMDGGIAADTPVPEARDLGATVMFVLPTYSSESEPGQPSRPHSAIQMGLHAIGQLLGHVTDDAMAETTEQADVYLLPAPPSGGIAPFDLSGAGDLIDRAYELARGWLREPQHTAASA